MLWETSALEPLVLLAQRHHYAAETEDSAKFVANNAMVFTLRWGQGIHKISIHSTIMGNVCLSLMDLRKVIHPREIKLHFVALTL